MVLGAHEHASRWARPMRHQVRQCLGSRQWYPPDEGHHGALVQAQAGAARDGEADHAVNLVQHYHSQLHYFHNNYFVFIFMYLSPT